MDTYSEKSQLLWSTKDIEGLARDIFRIAGPDKIKEFRITLIPLSEGQFFLVEICGPKEYQDVIQKMSDQQKV